MKRKQRHQKLLRLGLAVIAGTSVIALGPGGQTFHCEAASKKAPTFSEIPGVTTTAQPPVVQVAPPAPAVVAPPAAASAPAAAAAAEASPALEDTKDKVLYSFAANEMELKAALAAFARANNLNIVPDNDVSGTVTLDVRDLPLQQMMRALLEASDCSWREEGGLIRVRNTETRTFAVDYLRLSRKGVGQSSATLGSGGMAGGGGGGGGGMGGGGGGGGMMGGGGGSMGGGGGGGGMNGGGSSFGAGSSSVNLTADNPVDFWKEITEEMTFVLTAAGKSSMAINRTAGIIQVTDRPSALKRVESYLKGVGDSVHRQVEIEAQLYDVTLNDQFQFGIDWVHVAEAYGGTMAFGGATLPVANGGGQLLDSAIGGLDHRVGSTIPGGNLSSIVFENFNTKAAVTALRLQGNVEVIATPRIRTLNNQTALIKVGEEKPFFNTTTTMVPGTTVGTSSVLQETVVNSITIGTILSITPQISENDYVSLDISPVLTSLREVISISSSGSSSGGGGGSGGGDTSATAPDLDTKQASTIVRVKDGTTVVIGGLIQTEKAKNQKKIPILGDIPFFGKILFTGTYNVNTKRELVIFVTPRIIRAGEGNATKPKPLTNLDLKPSPAWAQ
jgi:MSHA type pilus biogenesis protein MshL